MKKLLTGNYYKVKDYQTPLKFIGIFSGDYICDYCNKNHYTKTLPKLYCFEIDKDNFTKYGTKCITKVIDL